MTQSTIKSKSYNSDITNCINIYMEQKLTFNYNSNERTIYDELDEKDRDLMLAAEIGQALMDANETLKHKNESLIEEFQQRIYEMENEKIVLKKKLDAVEYDYEMQLHALQKDIVALRKDLSCQKSNYHVHIEEKDVDIGDLVKNNQALLESLSVSKTENSALVRELLEVEDRMNTERQSMHGHLNQLEQLKSEILCLREEKKQLETRICDLMEERNCLLRQFHEAQQQNADLERIDKQNRETIALQEQDVRNLQQTAEFLQESINHFQKKKDTAGEVNLERQCGAPRPSNIWWKVWVEGDMETVEMDDDSVMTTLAMSGETPFDAMTFLQEEAEDNSQPSFVRELKVDVIEVYAQMRTICADLSFRYCADPNKPGSTPDELAIVEMDFKLGSLRDTLHELRGLLSDLIAPSLDVNSVHTVQKRMDEMRATLDEKSAYLTDLKEELQTQQHKLDELLTASDQYEDVEDVRELLLNRKKDLEQRVTRTRSEMDMLTSSMVQQEPWLDYDVLQEEHCEYD